MFRFNRTFFIITNFLLATALFTLIFLLRYSWFDFPGFSKQTLEGETLFLFTLYSLSIVTFNIAFKVYELNKISAIKESILLNFIISLLSIGLFGAYFYFSRVDFARFVFFSGFIVVPFALSIYNKLLFQLIVSRQKSIKLLYFGGRENGELLERLLTSCSPLIPFETTYSLVEDGASNLESLLKGCDYLIIDSDRSFEREHFQLLNRFEIEGGRIYSLIDIFAYLDQSLPAEIISRSSHFELFSTYKLDSIYSRILKRIEDIIIASLLLILTAPITLTAMLLIRLTSPGKIFYIQKRVGLKGKSFSMFKFRTMVSDAERDGARLTTKNDSRITSIGKIMRPLRIDELPQLVNILRGEMSFIGPRPERRELIEKISARYPLFNKRLLIKPGLTGWAQVKYIYANKLEEMNNKLSYDLYYINNLSLLFDLKIILYTIETVLFKKGAM